MKVKKKGLLWLWVVAAIVLLLETAVLSQQQAPILVSKYNDSAGDGITGPNQRMAGWVMTLEQLDINGTWAAVGNCTTLNNVDCQIPGPYQVNGTFRVKETMQPGWVPTSRFEEYDGTCLGMVNGTVSNPFTVDGDWAGQTKEFYNWQPTCDVTTTAALPICEGESIELLANTTEGSLNCTQFTQITWNSDFGAYGNQTDTGATWTSDNNTGLQRVGYIASFPDGVTCRDLIRFTVNPAPLAEITNDPTTFCAGDPQPMLEGEDVNGTWTGTGVIPCPEDNASSCLATRAAYTTNITYTVQNEFNCSASDTKEFTVNPLPPIETLGEIGPFCVGDPYVALVPEPGGGSWTSDPTGPGYVRTTGNGTWYFDPVVVGNPTLIYELTDNVTSCINFANTTVSVRPLPVVSAGEYPPFVCENDPPVALNGTPAGGTWDGDGLVNGTWFDPAQAGPGPGNLTYIYTSPRTSCTDSDTTTIFVEPAPSAPEDGSAKICKGETVELPMDGPEGSSLRWFEDGCGGGDPLTGDPVVVKPSKTTTYYGQSESSNAIICFSDECAEFVVEVEDCAPVPTLNEWGLIIFMVLMAATGAWYVVRKKRTA